MRTGWPLGVSAISSASARPTRPKPSSTTSVDGRAGGRPPPIFESWNAACTLRAASAASSAVTTNEMLRSDEPWAMATMLTPLVSSAVKTRAAMPGRAGHAVADHGNHRQPGPRGDAVDGAGGDLGGEGLAQAGHGAIGLRFRHGEADRAFRRGLEDRRHRQPLGVDRGEGARGDAVHADHALAGHGDHGLEGQHRHRLHRVLRRHQPPGHRRARAASGRGTTAPRA